MTVGWLDGMVLAAIAAEDPGGAAARAGLGVALSAALGDGIAALDALERSARRAEIRRLAAALRAVPVDADLPPRAASLLVADVPKEVGRAWLARAPRVRRGFAASPSLRATLRRLAAPSEPDADAREAEAADTVDARFTPAQASSLRRWAARLAIGVSPRRVLGALALGAAAQAGGPLGGDARSRPWRRIGRELAEVWRAPWRG